MQSPTSVMIVDADPTIAATVQTGLSAEGYTCGTASSAETALDMMHAAPVDVIMANLLLPGLGALGLAREAKKVKPDVAIVIVIDDIDVFVYDKAMERGASDFIVKPFSMRELAIRVRHVVHQETLRVVSVTDELTAFYNRRGFFTLAEQQLKLARRQGKGIYMLYADVDHLKSINDTWGHRAGDLALVETGQLLRDTYRESDIVARIGGDEFVVIPIGSTGDNIGVITARLQINLDARRARGELKYLRSLSIGVAYYDPEHPCTLEEFLHDGDRLMYENKKAKAGAQAT